jgi:hypothetical protein
VGVDAERRRQLLHLLDERRLPDRQRHESRKSAEVALPARLGIGRPVDLADRPAERDRRSRGPGLPGAGVGRTGVGIAGCSGTPGSGRASCSPKSEAPQLEPPRRRRSPTRGPPRRCSKRREDCASRPATRPLRTDASNASWNDAAKLRRGLELYEADAATRQNGGSPIGKSAAILPANPRFPLMLTPAIFP